MILIVVVPILLVLLVIRSARVRSQEKQQLLNEQAQGILGFRFRGHYCWPLRPALLGLFFVFVFLLICLRLGRFVLLFARLTSTLLLFAHTQLV